VDDNTQVVADNEGRELKRGFFLCEVSSSKALFRQGKQLCDTSTGVARCICEDGWKGSRCKDRIYEPPSIPPTNMPTTSRVGSACILSSDCSTENAYCVEGQCCCQSGFTPVKEVALILMSVKKATLMDVIEMLTVLTWKVLINVFVKMDLQMPILILLEETVHRQMSASSGLTIVMTQLKFVWTVVLQQNGNVWKELQLQHQSLLLSL
jgi:EB module